MVGKAVAAAAASKGSHWWKSGPILAALQPDVQTKLLLDHLRCTALPADVYSLPWEDAKAAVSRSVAQAMLPDLPLPQPPRRRAVRAAPVPALEQPPPPAALPEPCPQVGGSALASSTLPLPALPLTWDGDDDGLKRPSSIAGASLVPWQSTPDAGEVDEFECDEKVKHVFFSIANPNPQLTKRPFKSTDSISSSDMVATILGHAAISEGQADVNLPPTSNMSLQILNLFSRPEGISGAFEPMFIRYLEFAS